MSFAMKPVGKTVWVIPEGYIPADELRYEDKFVSHETACILNPNSTEAHIDIHIFFSDREPIGPYRVTVPPMRTMHLRFNDLSDPESIPKETDYASVFEASCPVVIQHTRLDTRGVEKGLLSTMAYGE